MSVKTIAAQFVELCRGGKNFDVMRTLYSPTIVSVGCSVTLRALPQPRSRITMRGWSSAAVISNVTAASKTVW